jgi:hypothetical protein
MWCGQINLHYVKLIQPVFAKLCSTALTWPVKKAALMTLVYQPTLEIGIDNIIISF